MPQNYVCIPCAAKPRLPCRKFGFFKKNYENWEKKEIQPKKKYPKNPLSYIILSLKDASKASIYLNKVGNF